MNDSTIKRTPSLQNFFFQEYGQEKAREFVFEGFMAFRHTDYARAEKCFRDALTWDPNNQSAQKYVSLFDAVKQGNFEHEAMLNQRKAGNMAKAQEHLETAKSCFQQAVRLECSFPPARGGLSRVFSSEGFDKLARGDYEGALTVFRILFNFNPGFNTAYVPLIHLLMQKGKAALDRKEFEVAEQFLLEAVQVDKFSALPMQELVNLQIVFNIEYALSKEDSPHEALVLLKKALAFDSLNGRALLYSGMCYQELGMLALAMHSYKKIREESIDNISVPFQIQKADAQNKKHARLFGESEKCVKTRNFDKAIELVNDILDDCSLHEVGLRHLEKIKAAKEAYAQKQIVRAAYTRKLRPTALETTEGNASQSESHKRQRNGR